MAITAGIYELRSMLLTSMAVTGSGYTPVKGSNVFLWAWNDGGNRKWRLTKDANSRWRLQNAANGLYMTLGSNTPANGVNVRQWTSSTGAIQYWNIIDTGETAAIDGYECPIVRLGNYATTDGATWMLDVDRAMTTNNANMEINRTSSADSQKFLLVPSTLLNNSYPVPSGLGWTATTSGNPYRIAAGAGTTALYLGWRCPSTWVPDGTRTFERRVRKRSMSAATSTWGAWGEWEQWVDVDPLMRGEWCYDLNTLDPSFDATTTKAVEFQAELRAKNGGIHGKTATNTLRNIVSPTATFTSAGASAEGLLVDVTSDYAPAWYGIKSIDMGGTELLAREVTAELLEAGQSLRITIPWSRLLSLGIPDEGATATAHYTKSTDLFTNYSGGRTSPATLDLGLGEGPEVEPTVTPDDGLTLEVTHPLGILGAWTSDGDGVYPTEDGSHVVYPFGKAFDLLVAVGDGTVWHQSMPAQAVKPCHAWNWDGGALLLEVATGRMVTSRTVKATADVLELDSRPWQAVTFAETLQGTLKASGALHDGSASTVADVMALMRAHHATYRAPSGEVMHVAVTDAQYESASTFTDVDVSMVQEAR